MSVLFRLSHPVAVIAFMICRGLWAHIFCRVRREQSANCFVWILYEIVLFCSGKNCMWVWLYVFLGCTRTCVCVDVMVMSSA